jgi:hypothetical protein
MKKIIEFELLRCEPALHPDPPWIAELHYPNSPIYPPSQIFGAGGDDKYEALWNLAQFVDDTWRE